MVFEIAWKHCFLTTKNPEHINWRLNIATSSRGILGFPRNVLISRRLMINLRTLEPRLLIETCYLIYSVACPPSSRTSPSPYYLIYSVACPPSSRTSPSPPVTH
uniref:Uncharacterized protein n=1 Tax=Lactuca sativa TaxID=4236 RepID=A0A9R1VNR4_LACSA|nr:hypothetical protein LSAT_V11C500268030 [Lactuca sativa]